MIFLALIVITVYISHKAKQGDGVEGDEWTRRLIGTNEGILCLVNILSLFHNEQCPSLKKEYPKSMLKLKLIKDGIYWE